MERYCGEREMDEEMEDTFREEFVVVEMDLDYEFDAARHFDFSRNESFLEAEEVEGWFETAGSYLPSPFIVKLNWREGINMGNVNTSPKSKNVENTYLVTNDPDTDGGVFNLTTGDVQKAQNEPHELTTGFTFYDHVAHDVPKAKTKASATASLWRSSTLMKPTASQLAKQNRPQEVINRSQFQKRFQKPIVQTNEKSSENPIIHAAKRQKLEGGHLRKVDDLKHEFSLAHKVPAKSGPVEGNSMHAKLKLTVPRVPELETAQRAQRTRPKINTELGEHVKSTQRTFKARPLNRKILEAPSLPLPKKSTPRLPEFQVFNLKTSERALQHSTAVSSTSLPCDRSNEVVYKPSTNYSTQNETMDSRRPNSVDAPKEEIGEIMHKFKARPLNKKIFSSKGEIGVFRNNKREATVPLEFNFSTDKRFQHNPPIELFNKLSLTSELQPNTMSREKLPCPPCIPMKGSKENTLVSFQQEHRTRYVVKEKHLRLAGKLIQLGTDRGITENGPRTNLSRSLGIR